jgi:hypothetical protein
MKSFARILYHTAIILLSAGIAWSLPFLVHWIAQRVLLVWSFIADEQMFLIGLEVAFAVLLILFLNDMSRTWKDRRLSRMAHGSGLVRYFPVRGMLQQRKIRRLKEKQGYAREVMILGSTGFRTFVDPRGHLHRIVKNCREAKILLVDPYSDGMEARVRSLMDPHVTLDRFRDQIMRSIDYLKKLRASQKNVRLKLYRAAPFLKLTILGDYLWMQHYHTGLEVQVMPEYAFRHNKNPGGLYTVFYQYFMMLWNDPDLPEYDLTADELVYRDITGKEVRREKFVRKRCQEPFTEMQERAEVNRWNRHSKQHTFGGRRTIAVRRP